MERELSAITHYTSDFSKIKYDGVCKPQTFSQKLNASNMVPFSFLMRTQKKSIVKSLNQKYLRTTKKNNNQISSVPLSEQCEKVVNEKTI